MATVTAVEASKPRVKSITLKLDVYEANDMLTFIKEWFNKHSYSKVENNTIYKALTAGLNGETTTDLF